MKNLRMQEKLLAGDCLDVRKEGVELEHSIFKLNRFIEDVDYCDAVKEEWIWSIGKHRVTGEIFASTTSVYYLHPDYECLFLR